MLSRYHIRRKDRQVTDPALIDAILREGRFATFALIDAGEPYVVTLSYGYDVERNRLYFHVAHEGRKLEVIAANPRACGTIVVDDGYEAGACAHPYRSIVMEGTMRLVEDDDEKLHAIRTLVNHLEPDPEGYWTSRPWSLEERIRGFRALAFDIETLCAKAGS